LLKRRKIRSKTKLISLGLLVYLVGPGLHGGNNSRSKLSAIRVRFSV